MVWTDVVQSFIMFGGLILIVYKGTMDAGGFWRVMELNYQSSRIEPPK